MSLQETLPFEPIVAPGEESPAVVPTTHTPLNLFAEDIQVEPLDATFKDSNRAPLHSWFPYLEGYSPRFVRRVRGAFLPHATHVLEPFAGSGTTPVVLGQDGVRCSFAEANPVMALIAQTKLAVMDPGVDRTGLSKALVGVAGLLPTVVAEAIPATDLAATYAASFGKSQFFRPAAQEQVLRLRTVNDQLAEEHGPLMGQCFSVAVMSALIPASLLKRSGDVRYKTEKELAKGLPDVVVETADVLVRMAHDLLEIAPLRSPAQFVGSDAKEIHLADGVLADGVITSPPYLNGTNYIRNARLELWYLRLLSQKADLRSLRDVVVTSGINDVNRHTNSTPVSEGVRAVVRELEEQAYDQRIAKMVGGYFVDMKAVLERLREVVRPLGSVCIDIGDSVYANVHVRTDMLLAEVAQEVGFELTEHVYLRKRRSLRGAELRQTLLVFRAPPSVPNLPAAETPTAEKSREPS